jgi:multidrug efflux system outer membrane protein
LIVRAFPSRFIPRNLRALVPAAVLTLSGAACVAHTTPPAAAIHPAPLTRWDASAFSDQPYDPLWWRQLDDPVLVQLEDAALAANHDVRIAVARVDEARAVFDEQRRDRYPKVTVGAYVDVRDQQIDELKDSRSRSTRIARRSTRRGSWMSSDGSARP